MKEFELIAKIQKEFAQNNRRRGLVVGIGDDCSVIRPPKGMLLTTTIDSLVEGNHFSLKYFTPREIGRKAIRVNLSDLASMGAQGPYYAWLVFSISPDVGDDAITGVLKGVGEDCKKFGVVLAGGNITSSKEFQIHVALSGWVRPGKFLTRTGAKPGDSIFISGTIGAASIAYRQFREGRAPAPELLRRWANPSPKIKLGLFLAEKKIASACIDVSDGVFQDLRHVTDDSGVGAELNWEKIPIHPGVKSPTPRTVGFGEDYELLFTVPQKKIKRLSPFKKEISEIGRITRKGFSLLDSNGIKMDISNVGYIHTA